METASREARVLGEYLLGVTPSERVMAAYAKVQNQVSIGDPVDRFDLFLLRYAMRGSLPARGADFYARVLRPNAWLRRKLILLLALSEVHESDSRIFGIQESSGPGVF